MRPARPHDRKDMISDTVEDRDFAGSLSAESSPQDAEDLVREELGLFGGDLPEQAADDHLGEPERDGLGGQGPRGASRGGFVPVFAQDKVHLFHVRGVERG